MNLVNHLRSEGFALALAMVAFYILWRRARRR